MYSLDFTQMNQVLGDYCRDNDQELIRGIYIAMPLSRYHVIDNVTDETPLPRMTIGDVVRPAQPQNFITGTNTVKFTSRMIKARGAEINLKMIPKEAINSYLGKFLKKGTDPYDMPFIEYIMADVLKKAAHEIALQCLWKGIYNANGTTAADVCDGFGTLITNEIAVGTISVANKNMVNTGVITPANVIDKLELVADGISEECRHMECLLYVAPSIFDWYNRAYRAIYGHNADYKGMTDNDKIKIDGKNVWITLEPALSGSQRVVCTPMENMVIGVDSMSDYGTLRTEPFERQIKLLGDLKISTQIAQLDQCFVTNEQA